MKYFRYSTNIFINGDNYLDGLLGLRCFPSDDAKRAVAEYEQLTTELLMEYIRTYTSYWVIQEIKAQSPRTVQIVPAEFAPEGFPKEQDNAFTGTYDNKWDKASKAATHSQTCGEDPVGANKAVGGGASVLITFSPKAWSMKKGAGSQGPGSAGDEILFHELIHAMRYMAGQGTRCAPCPPGFRDFEEFAAVVLTNVFSSELKRPQLRQDLWGYSPLPQSVNTSATFYAKYGQFLKPFYDHKHLVSNLRKATGIPFNPFVFM